MFFFRYSGNKYFESLGGSKYYRRRMFSEQGDNAEYGRGIPFFFKYRIALMRGEWEVIGIQPTMSVKFIGKGSAPEQVLIGGRLFRRGQWETVTVNFDSRDESGQDLFMVLGFEFKSPAITKSDLRDIVDGQSILVLRRFGGLGDIVMQSMIFPEIRSQFPNSKIIYAIPKQYHPLFENCTDIDEVMDSSQVDSQLPRLIVSGKYDFIGDISSTCVEYEFPTLNKIGIVDKERPDIWAEGMGITLSKHKTCIKLTDSEIETDKFTRLSPVIGLVTHSGAMDRSYPHGQRLIDDLTFAGYQVLVIHSKDLGYYNCEKLINPDLRTLMATISGLDAMISVDTGPMHIAGIFGVPLVGLFGVTDHRVRLSYYNAVGLQGACQQSKEPCWSRESAFCSKGTSGISACMYIEPKVIVEKLKELLNA